MWKTKHLRGLNHYRGDGVFLLEVLGILEKACDHTEALLSENCIELTNRETVICRFQRCYDHYALYHRLSVVVIIL